MKYLRQASLLTVLPALVAAHRELHIRVQHKNIHPRQIPSSDVAGGVPSPANTLTGATSTREAASTSSTVSNDIAISTMFGSSSRTAATEAPLVTTPAATFHLQSTNPTAVPLSSVNSAQPSSATKSLDSTAVAGTVPTFLPGAPALPNGEIYPVHRVCFFVKIALSFLSGSSESLELSRLG